MQAALSALPSLLMSGPKQLQQQLWLSLPGFRLSSFITHILLATNISRSAHAGSCSSSGANSAVVLPASLLLCVDTNHVTQPCDSVCPAGPALP
jgi:hypothetical protein